MRRLANQLEALPKKQDAKVQVKFTLGPLYHLRTITIDGDLPESARAALSLKSGEPAVASTVLAAGDKLHAALGDRVCLRQGRPRRWPTRTTPSRSSM